ncbi:hypothetical protein AB0C06_29305 [Micromonospora inaquosa]|uniref:hypothetical protein n=1 Tax=Micromonospora inaquosa TaxID=2203716 RepID=UPI003404A50A
MGLPDVMAQAVMDALRRANEQLAERSQQIIAEAVGTESAAARAIADRVDRQLRPDPEPGWGEPDSYDDHGWRR